MSTGAVHTEQTFEDAIEHALLERGWTRGDPEDFDRERALTPNDVFAFIQDTQSDLWRRLEDQQGDRLKPALLDALDKHLATTGTLDVLRRGFKFYGQTLRLAYFRPAHGLNPDVLERYRENRLVATRQAKFIPGKEDSLDLLLSLNGLPLATIELKNPLTGQNVRDAIKQYKRRDHRLELFQFTRRALVHFAVDPDLVYMTTRLQGKGTRFLPFNKGHDKGAGNPPVEDGYRAAYLWDDVLERGSFLDIVGRFMHVEREETWEDGRKRVKETLLFPRYHQLDCVRELVAATRSDGPGRNYLVQHSTGAGKTNEIAWLAHRLQRLHDAADEKIFDSVVVITDRLVLDRQLQDAIYQIDHKQGVVARIEKDSSQLAEKLESGAPIIITTLQKFPYMTDKIGELPGQNYAVIVDEAHSSQTGESARQLKEVLAPDDLEEAAWVEAGEEERTPDAEDRIVEVMRSRGPRENLSFYAFTATPKPKTLELFGREGPDGEPAPFHLYSMRQAIEEDFIFDVLKHYTTYKTYYRLVKRAEEDREVPKRRARVALARFMTLHPHNIAQKTEVIIEHFRQKVQHKIGGRAKAMVLTSSRLHAVRYKRAFERYIQDQGYDALGVLVAFSGTVEDPDSGQEFTEPGMNDGIQEKQLPQEFAGDDWRLLIVANKYQTGFDQPLLHTMYVDKRLSGIRAVQALGRLNRTHPRKEDTFVLDFVNDAEEIQAAFQDFYEGTTLSERADSHQLYDLKHKLDDARVYHASEVENFAGVFYKAAELQTSGDQAQMYGYLQPAVDRFRALEEEAREEFRGWLVDYVRLYGFLSQVVPWQDADLEMLYTFARFLKRRLPGPERARTPDLEEDVELEYYRLQKITEGTIQLEAGEGGVAEPVTAVGTGRAGDEEAPLSEIIEVLNERFGTDFTEADQLFFDQVTEEAKRDEDVVQRAQANPFESFALVMKKKLTDVMIDRMGQNEEIVSKYLGEEDFQEVAFQELARRIYEEVRGKAA